MYIYKRFKHKFIHLMRFSPFRYYVPFEKGMALHLNKHDFPSPKDALCQVWLKLALWFFKVPQCNFAISLLSPLENEGGGGGSFIKTLK